MKKVAAILLCTVLLLSCLGCSMYDLKGIRLKGALRTETMQSEDPCQKIVIKDLSFYDSASCNITIANGPSVSVQTNLPEDLYDEYGFTVSLQDVILLLTTAESLEFSLEEPAQIHITAPFNTLEVEGEFVVSGCRRDGKFSPVIPGRCSCNRAKSEYTDDRNCCLWRQ